VPWDDSCWGHCTILFSILQIHSHLIYSHFVHTTKKMMLNIVNIIIVILSIPSYLS
jgi:hypothetical protein